MASTVLRAARFLERRLPGPRLLGASPFSTSHVARRGGVPCVNPGSSGSQAPHSSGSQWPVISAAMLASAYTGYLYGTGEKTAPPKEAPLINPDLSPLLNAPTPASIGQDVVEVQKQSPSLEIYRLDAGNVIAGPSKTYQEAFNKAGHGYAPIAGIWDLRVALAKEMGRVRGVEYAPEEVIVFPGGKPAIHAVLQTLTHKGVTVFLPDIGYPIYKPVVEQYHGRVVHYEYRDLKNLTRCITAEKEKGHHRMVVVLNNHNNPGGFLYPDADLRALADTINEFEIPVLSDEAYIEVCNETKDIGHSLAKYVPQHTIPISTASKAQGVPGDRAGALVCKNPEVREALIKTLEFGVSCSPRPPQEAWLADLTNPKAHKLHLKKSLSKVQNRIDTAYDRLSAMGFAGTKPDSGFYLWLDAEKVMKATGEEDVEKFRLAVLKGCGVSFCTQVQFGGESDTPHPHIRLAFAGVSDVKLAEALDKLEDWIKENTKISEV